MDVNKKRSRYFPHTFVYKCRQSKNLLLAVITAISFLDYLLLTTIVSIMPEYLYNLEHPDHPLGEVINNPELYNTSDPKIVNNNSTLQKSFEGDTAINSTIISQELQSESVPIGIMFAAKPFLQIIANPFVGPLTHMIGYSIPMLTGLVILFTTTLAMAFGESYTILLLARAFQGIGSSFASVAGMGLIAETFTDEKQRGTAISISFSGLCVGYLIGPPVGGFFYEYVGYSAPYLIIAGLILLTGVMLLIVLPPSITLPEKQAPSLKKLITDPYIIIAAAIITVGNIGLAVLEPSLPLWMIDTMGSNKLEQGTIFLPSSAGYLIAALAVGRLGHLVGRWRVALIGMVLSAACLIAMPFPKDFLTLTIPNAGAGFGVGMIENSLMPELAHLVDIRHAPVYGTVYAVGNFAVSLSYVVGPALSAALVNNIGFKYSMFGIAILGVVVTPLLVLLKNPPTREETKPLLQEDSSKGPIPFKIEEPI